MRLAFRAAAENDLDGVFDYSVAEHGVGNAERYMRDVHDCIDRLLEYPQLGPVTGLRPGLRSYGVREHRIYYRIEGEQLVVARVLHKRMDARAHV